MITRPNPVRVHNATLIALKRAYSTWQMFYELWWPENARALRTRFSDRIETRAFLSVPFSTGLEDEKNSSGNVIFLVTDRRRRIAVRFRELSIFVFKPVNARPRSTLSNRNASSLIKISRSMTRTTFCFSNEDTTSRRQYFRIHNILLVLYTHKCAKCAVAHPVAF